MLYANIDCWLKFLILFSCQLSWWLPLKMDCEQHSVSSCALLLLPFEFVTNQLFVTWWILFVLFSLFKLESPYIPENGFNSEHLRRTQEHKMVFSSFSNISRKLRWLFELFNVMMLSCACAGYYARKRAFKFPACMMVETHGRLFELSFFLCGFGSMALDRS